jgi:hypothetical protein
MKTPLLFLVFLFCIGLGFSEIPEQIRLIDNTSNDLVETACGSKHLEPGSLHEVAASGRGLVEAVYTRTFQDFRISPVAEPFYLSGQDRLVLCSIQRT